MTRFKLSTLPLPENKPSGVCQWRGCWEASARLEDGAPTTMFCPPHIAQAHAEWQEVLAYSPGYRSYYEGKEE